MARTARHLRPVQWLYWPLRRWQARRPPPTRSVEGRFSDAWPKFQAEVEAWGPRRSDVEVVARALSQHEFTFLGVSATLPEVDWQREYHSRLWTYHLHYFEYALDIAWAYRRTGEVAPLRRLESLVDTWMTSTAGGLGPGWEPYVISQRVPNWILTLALVSDSLAPDLVKAMKASVLTQLASLERRRELHLQANHLQKNLQALAVGGLAFSGDLPDAWATRWLPALWREFGRQVAPDGGHAERAPMYHLIALGDLLETMALARVCGRAVPGETLAVADRMWRVARWYCRTDGSIQLLNDSVNPAFPVMDYLHGLARRILGPSADAPLGESVELPDTKFFGHLGTRWRCMIDGGAPAPPHQPGHAHNGVLSFELDFEGVPLIVDSGVSGYDGDHLREYVRSTRAHNTVMIDATEQSELWGTFRAGRRAKVFGVRQWHADGRYHFEGACQAYRGRAVHSRTIEQVASGWSVSDSVSHGSGATVRSFLHFHPSVDVLELGGDRYEIRGRNGLFTLIVFGADRIERVRGQANPPQGWYCPAFGVVEPATTLEMHMDRYGGQRFGYHLMVEGHD